MNTPPDTIKKRIEDEAEAVVKRMDSHSWDYHQGIRQGYTAAAEAILSKPEEYNLTPSDRVQQLEQALNQIATIAKHMGWDKEVEKDIEKIESIATNALKTISNEK